MRTCGIHSTSVALLRRDGGLANVSRTVPIALSLLAAVLLTGCPTPPKRVPQELVVRPKPRYEVYYVREGDTPASIARRFGVPWMKIQENNGLASPQGLRTGFPLLIPLHERTAPPRPDVPNESAPPAANAAAELIKVSRQALNRGKPSSAFWWPTEGQVTRTYSGSVRGFREAGIGLSAPAGTEVCAVADGKVICRVAEGRSPKPGWGNVVSIRHAGEIVSWYGYLDRVMVKEGDVVTKGQTIGAVGSSGGAERPELALRFFKNERPVNPLDYLP